MWGLARTMPRKPEAGMDQSRELRGAAPSGLAWRAGGRPRAWPRRLIRRLRPPPDHRALRLAARLIKPVEPLSRLAHDRLFRDKSQSLCARAWWLRDRHRFWRLWVKLFGPEHCRASFRHYHGR